MKPVTSCTSSLICWARILLPASYQIPFDPSKFGGLVGDPAYLVDQVLQFQAGIGGTYEAVYIDYVPPDLLKDNMMRGWQAPRAND